MYKFFNKKTQIYFLLIFSYFLSTNLVFANTTEIISVSSIGGLGNNTSNLSADFRRPISADGRFVVFQSNSSNLVLNDTNNARDIFVRDRELGTTERVSVSTGNVEANSASSNPSISSDGRFIVFESSADNLVSNDTNGLQDIFIYDRQAGVTDRVSVSNSEVESNGNSLLPSVSSGGRYVVFQSSATNLAPNDTNNAHDIFVRDRELGITERITINNLGIEGNNDSIYPMISDDGRHITFQSFASNLIAGVGAGNIFVYDKNLDSIEIVSVSSLGETGNDISEFPFISGNGRFIVFQSYANNLVSNDTNNDPDVFLRDRQTGITKRISLSLAGGNSDGLSGNPSISSDGKYATFWSTSSNLVLNEESEQNENFFLSDSERGGVMVGNFFLHNIQTGETQTLSRDAQYGLLSSNGNAVIFEIVDWQIEGDGNGFYDIAILVFDPVASDVSSSANSQSGSISSSSGTTGCTNPLALNYNPDGGVPGETCIFGEGVLETEVDINTPGKFEADERIISGEVKGFINEVRSDVSEALEKIPKGIIKKTSFLGLAFPALISIALPSQKLLGTLFHFLNLFLAVAGLKQKKKYWGIVYDSATKKPVISAVVSLKNNNGEEMYTTKTNLSGQFNFSPEPGHYHLSVEKDGYQFPSTKLTGEYFDGEYDNLYFSGEFMVTSKDEMIYKNIPLDAMEFNWSEYVKSEIRKTTSFQSTKNGFWQDVSTAVFFVGGLASVVACAISPSWVNITITGVYLAMVIVGMVTKRHAGQSHLF